VLSSDIYYVNNYNIFSNKNSNIGLQICIVEYQFFELQLYITNILAIKFFFFIEI